jgi:hypothetical protein
MAAKELVRVNTNLGIIPKKRSADMYSPIRWLTTGKRLELIRRRERNGVADRRERNDPTSQPTYLPT